MTFQESQSTELAELGFEHKTCIFPSYAVLYLADPSPAVRTLFFSLSSFTNHRNMPVTIQK